VQMGRVLMIATNSTPLFSFVAGSVMSAHFAPRWILHYSETLLRGMY
jgi:hypothetical protein